MILTNAHVVSNATYLEIQNNNNNNTKRFEGYIKFIADDTDLALIDVKDKSFYKNITPLTFGKLPNQFDKIKVLGFPTGGQSLSVTQGEISRYEFTKVFHSQKSMLVIQTDAAINPGNSGGPVVNKNNKVVGVAFQTLNLQNSSHVIPKSI